MNRINIGSLEQKLINNNIAKKKTLNNINKGQEFNDILNSLKGTDVKFSKHAKERLNSRNISINQFEMEKIELAIDKAKNKGVKDALILLNNQAFIANIDSRTVITAVEKDSLKESIFTNIDGAVII